MGINLRRTDVLPRLKINGEAVKCVKETVVLGDPFNSVGTKKHLIEDRTKKGKACIITAMSMCNEVTLGVYTIQTLLLLYRSLFLHVILHNSQAWCNITNLQITSLKTTQMKYLKRIFHAPSSTPNSITLLETGMMPIEQEINKRQLNFLHLILTLEENDPNKILYKEQLKFSAEKNWANEIAQLRQMYEITESDDVIESYTKEHWKNIVKRKLKSYATKKLNREMGELKHGSKISPYVDLKVQEYLESLQPQRARKLFHVHVRTGILDLRAIRKYRYTDSECRLCEEGEEDVDHVVNKCSKVPRSRLINNMLTNDIVEMEQIAERCITFATKLKELESNDAEICSL